MTTCPICMNTANNEGDTCSVCGYHFVDSTQEFAAISVNSETGAVSAGEGGHGEGVAASAPAVPTVPTVPEPTAAHLTLLYGKQEGLVFKLDSDLVQIGRSPKCGIMLNDMTVSRVHAELARINGEWVLTDSDSYNGVWVNNQAVKQVVLKNGDLFQIGCYVIRFTE